MWASVDLLDVEDLVLVGRGPLGPQVVDVGEMGVGVQDGKSLGHFRGESHAVHPPRFRTEGRAPH